MVTVRNAAPTQLEAWASRHTLYVLSPASAYATNPKGTIFLLPKSFRIPTTLHHWPSDRFTSVASVNQPATQIGTSTGTLWYQMSVSLYWLKPAGSNVLPQAMDASTSAQAIFHVPASQLFAVRWPDAAHPDRVLFLKPRTFAMPRIVHHWPSHRFRVVAVYPSKSLRSMGNLISQVRYVTEGRQINARARSAPLKALPPFFTRYADVRNTVGRRLAHTSDVPVYLPQHILSGPYHGPMDVRYNVQNGGFALTIGGGPRRPANSPHIHFGNADLFGTIKGMAWTPAFHARQRYMPFYPRTTSSGTTQTLSSGVTATVYSGQAQQGPVALWNQDGWTINVIGSPGTSQDVVRSQASSIASSLGSQKLPGIHGRATFAIGSGAPSEATYDVKGTRYFIYANGFKAVQLVRQMAIVKPS